MNSTLSKRTIGLIVGLFVVTAILLTMAIRSGNKSMLTTKSTSDDMMKPTPTPVAHSVLSLSPASLTVNPGTAQKLDVMIDTGINEVSGLQLEVSYDPTMVTMTSIVPGTFIPNPLILIPAKIDAKNGRASIAIAKTISQPGVKGTGTIATLAFTVRASATTPVQSTMIKLLPKTLVSAVGVEPSVLKSTADATIYLSSQSATTPAAMKVQTTPASQSGL